MGIHCKHAPLQMQSSPEEERKFCCLGKNVGWLSTQYWNFLQTILKTVHGLELSIWVGARVNPNPGAGRASPGDPQLQREPFWLFDFHSHSSVSPSKSFKRSDRLWLTGRHVYNYYFPLVSYVLQPLKKWKCQFSFTSKRGRNCFVNGEMQAVAAVLM